jgi:hypothetical protein
MNQRRCLKVALRIDTRLRAALSEGIDAQRMVADPLYARDVLLVCDAMAGSDLQTLASLYRKAAAPDSARPLLRAPISISGLLNSLFGTTDAGTQPGTSQPVKPVNGSQAGARLARRGASRPVPPDAEGG